MTAPLQKRSHIVQYPAQRTAAKASQHIAIGEKLLQHECSFLANRPSRAPKTMLTNRNHRFERPTGKSSADRVLVTDNSA
jgi:hypothetical protein